MLSHRAKNIAPSPTLGITAKAKKMQAEGIKVISFGAGEPDFDTPQNIKDACISALNSGFTKYTATSGIDELKEAICEKLKNDNNLNYKPSNIVVSCGAKHSLFNTIMVLCEKGNEVIIPSPYWVSYVEMVKIAEGIPIFLKTIAEDDFKINIEKLKDAITQKTKIIILNSPSNPTGAVLDESELKEIADIAQKNKIYIISDEIYEKIIYDGKKHISIASFDDEIKDLTVVINGLSKSYSMTGWRLGYTASSEEIAKAISNIQDHSTSNPTSFVQKAAVEALKGPQDELKKMVVEFDKRRNFIVEELNKIAGMSCNKPKGAFYIFPKVSELFGKKFENNEIKNSTDLANYLLDFAKVAVVPGIAFGDDEHIRLSYATSLDNIKEGVERIKDAVQKLY